MEPTLRLRSIAHGCLWALMMTAVLPLEAAPAKAPAGALIALEEAVRAGAGDAALAERALAVHQAVDAHRLRYADIYRDRLRGLEEALRAAPRNPDRLADLADFLFAESRVPFEQVEPHSWPVYYRDVPQGVPRFDLEGQILPAPPDQRTASEVARAEALVGEALQANPSHVRALGLKGTFLNNRGQHEAALAVLDKAVARKGNDPVLLRERSVALQGMARQNALAASGLRGPDISSTRNQDGSTTTVTVYPSEADLARASALERDAAARHSRAVEDMTRAQKLTAGTALGAYYQGRVDYAYHNVKQAQTDFQQAVKLDPNFRDAWMQLAGTSAELGLPEEWAAAKEGELRSIQTTAGPWLTVAWQRIVAAQFATARADLVEARRLDASDARTPAYEGAIAAANGQMDEAMVRYVMALALEEARGRLRARANPAPGPDELALTLALRQAMGGLLFERGQAERAGRLFKANLDFLSAIPPEKLNTPMPKAVLPSPATGPSAVTPVETCAMLKIRAQAGLDFVAWVGRYPDPRDVALAVATYKRLVAPAAVDSIKPEVLQAVMSLALAELEVSKGNHAHALELLRNEGATPQPLWQEMRKTEAAARAAGQALEQDRFQKEQDRRARMSPADAQRERLLSDRQAFERSRQSALEELGKPGLTDREKQVWQGSVGQYDRMIQDIDKKLRRLDGK